MNAREATAVLAKVVAYCPAMASQLGATADKDGDSDIRKAWTEAMGAVDFADACTAVRILGTRPLQPGQTLWIQPGHVIAEVHRIRARRLDNFDAAMLTGAPEDAAGYLAWRRATNRAVAEGRQSDLPQIEPDKHQVSADFIHELRARSRQEPPGREIS